MAIPATNPDTIRHALNRWGYGPTTALMSSVQASGLNAYLESQFSTWKSADAGANAAVAGFTTLGQSAIQLWNQYWWGAFWTPIDELQAAAIVRAVRADHQLFERMVEFWSDHFAIDPTGAVEWAFKPVDDRSVIRANALGRFEDMLIASAQSPAMLSFLDQWKSTGTNPNENYARELLELHTLGVDGGYTEADVKAAARLLTGWTINFSTYTFQFNAAAHDPRPVQILGVTYGGSQSTLNDGVTFVKSLARHPSTARHLATKLCKRFVSDTPSASLVQSVANAYLAANTDITATLRYLFNTSEFWSSANAKTRRPIDVLVAFLRATSAQFVLNSWDAATSDAIKKLFVGYFTVAGQAPFFWPTPDGFPEAPASWIHPWGMLTRWNIFLSLALGYVYGVTLNYNALLPYPQPATAGALVDRLCNAVLFRAPTAAERDAFLTYLGTAANVAVPQAYYMIRAGHLTALIASSPAFQLR